MRCAEVCCVLVQTAAPLLLPESSASCRAHVHCTRNRRVAGLDFALAYRHSTALLHRVGLAPVLNARNLLTFRSPSGAALGSFMGEPGTCARLCMADTRSAPGSAQRSCKAHAEQMSEEPHMSSFHGWTTQEKVLFPYEATLAWCKPKPPWQCCSEGFAVHA